MKAWIGPQWALLTGGLAAILASTCCLGPLVLLLLGFSGAWIGNLALLEEYKPLFVVVALVAMTIAWRRIYRPACQEGKLCSAAVVNRTYKILFWLATGLVVIALFSPYVLPFFYE